MACADEFINGKKRYCLWLVDAPPFLVREVAPLRKRIEKVRAFREASPKKPTQKLAAVPTLFGEIRQPSRAYILVPMHSSELRKYIPFAFVSPEVIIHNSCMGIADGTLFHFGMLSSVMHMTWVRTICGRIKSDFRYSNTLVYNNYPWPSDATDKAKANVEKAAGGVLDARTAFPRQSLADLYDANAMPPALTKAHQALDAAVDKCYRRESFKTDRDRLEYLFAFYEALAAPLVPAVKAKRKRSVN